MFCGHYLTLLHSSIRIFGILLMRQREADSLALFFLTERRHRRADEWIANDLMKFGVVVIEDQSFDTQPNLTTDLAGSLKSISMVTSRGIDEDDSVLSSFWVSMAFLFVPFPTLLCIIFIFLLTTHIYSIYIFSVYVKWNHKYLYFENKFYCIFLSLQLWDIKNIF